MTKLLMCNQFSLPFILVVVHCVEIKIPARNACKVNNPQNYVHHSTHPHVHTHICTHIHICTHTYTHERERDKEREREREKESGPCQNIIELYTLQTLSLFVQFANYNIPVCCYVYKYDQLLRYRLTVNS